MKKYTLTKVLSSYFRFLGVRVDSLSIDAKIDAHPLPDSIRTLSDTMDYYHIDNIACSLGPDQIKEVEPPFIVACNTRKDPFCIVTRMGKEKVAMYSPGTGKIKIGTEAFLRIWTGVVLAGEKTDKTHRQPSLLYYIKQSLWFLKRNMSNIICLLCFYILAFGFYAAGNYGLPDIEYLIIKTAGTIVSAIIIRKTLVDPKLFNRFCTSGKNVDCNDVLYSKAAKIFGFIGLGELSFAYFSGTLFWGLFLSPAPTAGYMLLSVPAAGFLLFSLIWQLAGKRLCTLCLAVDLMILLEIVTGLFVYNSPGFSLQMVWTDTINIIACISLSLLVTMWICSLIVSRKSMERYREKSSRMLSNPYIFNHLLLNSPQVADSSAYSPITNGVESDNKITAVLSPSCPHCVAAFESVRKLTDYRLDIIFATNEKDLAAVDTVEKFISSYLSEGWDRAAEVISYRYEHRSFPAEVETVPEAREICLEHRRYCKEIGLRHTPEIVFNGHEFPSEYDMEELPIITG